MVCCFICTEEFAYGMEQTAIAHCSVEGVGWITECIGIVMGVKGQWFWAGQPGQCRTRLCAKKTCVFARVRFCALMYPYTKSIEQTEQPVLWGKYWDLSHFSSVMEDVTSSWPSDLIRTSGSLCFTVLSICVRYGCAVLHLQGDKLVLLSYCSWITLKTCQEISDLHTYIAQ